MSACSYAQPTETRPDLLEITAASGKGYLVLLVESARLLCNLNGRVGQHCAEHLHTCTACGVHRCNHVLIDHITVRLDEQHLVGTSGIDLAQLRLELRIRDRRRVHREARTRRDLEHDLC